MPNDYQPVEYYLEKLGTPNNYHELLDDYSKVLAKLKSYEKDKEQYEAIRKVVAHASDMSKITPLLTTEYPTKYKT